MRTKTLVVGMELNRYPIMMLGIISFINATGFSYVKILSGIVSEEVWLNIFPTLDKSRLKHLTSSPSMFLIVEGDNSVKKMADKVREVSEYYRDNTKGWKGSISSSTSLESAETEIKIAVAYSEKQTDSGGL